jgi:two-component system, OmpR family, sensor histidine kinase BaeS
VSRLGLRVRLAAALVGVTLLAVGLATALSNRGLHPRVEAAAQARLERSADHFAEVAAAVYADQRGWTPQAQSTLRHLALLDDLRFRLDGPLPAPSATAPVLVSGASVGTMAVAPASGVALTPEEQELQSSLNRLHLVAGAVSALAALLLAFLLAETLSRPLRRIHYAARRIEEGDLAARVEPGGDPEMHAVAHALNRLAETLQHEEEIRKESVADLAHELRTPVSALLSRIEAAQDRVLADEKANLEAMHAEALRLARLLDDLTRLAEAERPGFLVEKTAVDLAEVGRREAEAFEPFFAAKGVRFAAHVEPVTVRGDADRLGQVVSNLLSNALRYTEPGGRVELRVAAAGATAVVEVADTGAGIGPEDLRHVFKRFWRGEKSRSRSTGGAGIGLAIVHELVRAHDGRIDVESHPGAGSTFRVVLPIVEARGVHENDRSASPDLRTPARS